MAGRRRSSKTAPVSGTSSCVRKEGKKQCPNLARHYVMGQWVCDTHNPRGDEACSHSLGTDRCAWCGADLKETT